MTGPQRKVHVLLWLVLGPLALAGLVLAVSMRPSEPVQEGDLPGVDSESKADVAGPDEGVSP